MNADLAPERRTSVPATQRTDIAFSASPRQLFLIEQAAAKAGKTFADFVVESAAARAEYMLVNQSRLVLDQASMATILQAIGRPASERPITLSRLADEEIVDRRPIVEKLEREFDLSRFDCGYSELNDWLRHLALPGQFMNYVHTYVIRSGHLVVGYHALGVETFSTYRIPGTEGSDALPQNISAMILLRLAVDRRHQRIGLGRTLLRDAIARFTKEAQNQGLDVLLIHAKNENVQQLYVRCGFTPLPAEPFTLFLTRNSPSLHGQSLTSTQEW